MLAVSLFKADVRMRKRASVCQREGADVAVLGRYIKNTLGDQRTLARKALSSKPLVNKENSEEQWKAEAIVDVELATAAGEGWREWVGGGKSIMC